MAAGAQARAGLPPRKCIVTLTGQPAAQGQPTSLELGPVSSALSGVTKEGWWTWATPPPGQNRWLSSRTSHFNFPLCTKPLILMRLHYTHNLALYLTHFSPQKPAAFHSIQTPRSTLGVGIKAITPQTTNLSCVTESVTAKKSCT